MRKSLLFLLYLFLPVMSLFAQWDGNPATVDNPVNTSPGYAGSPAIIPDGAGGIISVWVENDPGFLTSSIYAQRKTSTGAISWNTASTPVHLYSLSTVNNYGLTLLDVKSDGANGAYVSWQANLDDSTSDLYLQRLSSSGAALFGAGGMLVKHSSGHNYSDGRICTDGTGFIISWTDEVYPLDSLVPVYSQVFVQRYSNTGLKQWAANGVQVSTAAGLRAVSEIISDGNNGAFVAFSDSRNSSFDTSGNTDNADIYAQHISSSGSRLWGASDAVVSTAAFNQFSIDGTETELYSSMISDSAGGFILIYEDYRNNNDSAGRLYAQRLNSNGTRLWSADGVPLHSPSPFYPYLNAVMSDGFNGVVACWDVNAYSDTGNSYSLKVQRINSAGNASWGAEGLVAGSYNGMGYQSGSFTRDAAGFYVGCWSYDDSNGNPMIRAQKVNGAGQLVWAPGGVDICTNPSSLATNPVITFSDNYRTIISWMDQRNYATSFLDAYAAKINQDGTLYSAPSNSYVTIANGNWSNPASWQGGMVPPYGADVIIHHTITANVSTTVNSLRVEPPGSILINAGVNIVVLH